MDHRKTCVQTLVMKSDQYASIVDDELSDGRSARYARGVNGWRECSLCCDSEKRVGDAEHHESDCCVRSAGAWNRV